MRTRAILLILVLALPALSGCVDAFDETFRSDEPAPPQLNAPGSLAYKFAQTNVTINVSDGVALRATLYQPQAAVSNERFPAVLFIHGWGGDRGTGGGQPREDDAIVGQMKAFAADGYAVLAYDVRGFGESGGLSTLAGPREMQDMREVIDWFVNSTAWNGKLGIVGRSYGAGHAMWGLVHDERVTTIVSHYGWNDLAAGLAPDRIPKAGWIATLLFVGYSGGGQYDPIIYEWLQKAAQRDDIDSVITQLHARSTFNDLPNVTKPVLLLEGMDETLFPQALDSYARLTNATDRHVYLFEGGHGAYDAAAWTRAHEWFDRYLKREQHGVDAWPAVVAPAPWAGGEVAWNAYPPAGTERVAYWLADDTPGDGQGTLADASEAPGPDARARFTGTARSGAFDDPSVIRDSQGFRAPVVPTTLRAAPGEAALFRSAPLNASVLLVGSPVLNVTMAPGPAGAQLVARLYAEAADGSSRLLSRGGIDPTPVNGEAPLTFTMTRAITRVEAGERFVLIIAGDDVTYTSAYKTPFTAEAVFGGETGAGLMLPLLATS